LCQTTTARADVANPDAVIDSAGSCVILAAAPSTGNTMPQAPSMSPGPAAPRAGDNGTDMPGYSMEASRNFKVWLAENRCALAFSTYQRGALFLIGLQQDGRLSQSTHRFARCMGLHADGDKIWAASLHQLWRFANHTTDLALQQGTDRVYRPRVTYVTGDLDIHEMAETAQGELIFVNTLFSCLARPSVERSFAPVWKPAFISRLAAEDRCHLNGLAMRDGQPYAVTAVAQSDVAQGWRDHRQTGGVVIDVATDAVLCRGLSMPHSPRWAFGRLWVLNSGTGGFGHVDPASGTFQEVTFCPGFARGMALIGRFAVIGLSRPRGGGFSGLALQERLAHHRVEPRCGLMVVDLETGSAVEWLRISGAIEELFDVAVLPQTRQPVILADPKLHAGQFVDF
jgi:uncharacterized protein (TIGR03032 family)